jgi:hypothetical protein
VRSEDGGSISTDGKLDLPVDHEPRILAQPLK